MRIAKGKNSEFGKTFPAQVASRIRSIAGEYHNLKSLIYHRVSPGEWFYVAEGERYLGIKADGTIAGFEVVSASTLGASGLSHKIGERFSMPANTWLVRVSYYTRYYMDVYAIGSNEIDS